MSLSVIEYPKGANKELLAARNKVRYPVTQRAEESSKLYGINFELNYRGFKAIIITFIKKNNYYNKLNTLNLWK
ncbi:hypothetical protein LX66_3363 [Chitinophaga japonensis]|uniref:Uncharacterized protein n=1 Tax=Chitinophaga japonensis TaxID=104662 RepID=A0A562T7V1_CHIJA|nr:hypothetical protein LX66_3363 [Chitinophaga japonensis]